MANTTGGAEVTLTMEGGRGVYGDAVTKHFHTYSRGLHPPALWPGYLLNDKLAIAIAIASYPTGDVYPAAYPAAYGDSFGIFVPDTWLRVESCHSDRDDRITK